MPTAPEALENAFVAAQREIDEDPLAIWCEKELQVLLHRTFQKHFPEQVEVKFASGVRDARTKLQKEAKIGRSYRELTLNPDAGQRSPRPDLVLLENREQRVLAKNNGAPSSFSPPYEALVEAKVAISWPHLDLQPKKPNFASARKDLEKLKNYFLGPAKQLILVVLTTHPEECKAALAERDDRIELVVLKYPNDPEALFSRNIAFAEHPTNTNVNVVAYQAKKLRNLVELSLSELHKEQKEHPLLYFREKDFETRLVELMRSNPQCPTLQFVTTKGKSSRSTGVRSQWSSKPGGIATKRIHDILVRSEPLVVSSWGDTSELLPFAAELELKTSHSNEHNWFVKRDLLCEISTMQRMRTANLTREAWFLLFRFGQTPEAWWHSYNEVKTSNPNIQFCYFSSSGGSITATN